MSSPQPLARCFGVFGDPIGHSRSPVMHAAAFAALGLPHCYLPFHVSSGSLGEAVRGAAALGLGGVNLTVPHKQAALELCDRRSDTVQRVGAVNTLCFVQDAATGATQIHGHNTDARGFLDALDELPGASLRHATILGAGGASVAIADALLGAFADVELTWVSRAPERIVLPRDAEARARVRPLSWEQLGAPTGELLINTTIVGLAGGPRAFPVALELGKLEAGARVVDIVYPRPAGGLLERAAAAGFAVQDGLPMLLWQGVRALELWLDLALPDHAIERMRGALGLAATP
ncbi:Shikimate 5-dehydrogenase I alpha [Enhygromyxa salina]|uniref:Shikimate dehydrogenase (NADP(+)) n=1 Tax=Enhygromyxa salina TaxID=215803 RepID=A0A0C2D3I0_9BACT|nr:shikimate dehydrogenase [Enhygromyxa salina]KIG17766.1 Shikimate 5-dehydrogenase I alpha [Enhygromyxa salina]